MHIAYKGTCYYFVNQFKWTIQTNTSSYPSRLHFQSLQEEPTSTSSQLAELMMAARVNLTSELPRDLPSDALLNHGNFLINLEGEEDQH